MRYKNSLREFLIESAVTCKFRKIACGNFSTAALRRRRRPLSAAPRQTTLHSLGTAKSSSETTLLYSPAMASASTISASADFAADSIDAQVVAYEVVVLPTAARRSLFAESPKL